MTDLTITGDALAVFSFPWDNLKSWNDLVYMHRYTYSSWAKKQREMGAELALAYMNMVFKAARTRVHLVHTKALVIIKVYVSSDGKVFDVTNPCLKHVMDGFTDQRIWPDDEWAFLPVAIFMWGGIDQEHPRFDLEVHQLNNLVINGKAQSLPLGREKT